MAATLGPILVRIAYLIMAHEHPSHLRRLVDALDCSGAAFYVHIDSKSDDAPFRQLLSDRENVRFIEERVPATWMGFSLVEISLKLLWSAVRDGFDYCVQLSGVDYPIKSNDYLQSFFQRADKEYLTFWRLEDRPSWLHKVAYYYFIDAIPIRGWSTGQEHVYWRRLFWGRFFKYQKYFPKRRFLPNMVPYGGSDWWSLSYGCAQYVLSFLDEHPEYSRFYRFTAAPCEMFFQTIVLNSPWAKRVENHQRYEAWSRALVRKTPATDAPMLPESAFNYRYIDWSGETTGTRETPAILDDRDWDQISRSHCHFARKFDPRRSAGLLARIDHEILGLGSAHLVAAAAGSRR